LTASLSNPIISPSTLTYLPSPTHQAYITMASQLATFHSFLPLNSFSFSSQNYYLNVFNLKISAALY
jgi:hypothetical protein